MVNGTSPDHDMFFAKGPAFLVWKRWEQAKWPQLMLGCSFIHSVSDLQTLDQQIRPFCFRWFINSKFEVKSRKAPNQHQFCHKCHHFCRWTPIFSFKGMMVHQPDPLPALRSHRAQGVDDSFGAFFLHTILAILIIHELGIHEPTIRVGSFTSKVASSIQFHCSFGLGSSRGKCVHPYKLWWFFLVVWHKEKTRTHLGKMLKRPYLMI